MNVGYIDNAEERKTVTLGSTRTTRAFSPMKMQLPGQKPIVFGRRSYSPHRLWRSKKLLASLVAISILAAWIAVSHRWAPASDIRPTSYPDRYERATIFERQALAPPLTFEDRLTTCRWARSIARFLTMPTSGAGGDAPSPVIKLRESCKKRREEI
jgi:hypothetical protein